MKMSEIMCLGGFAQLPQRSTFFEIIPSLRIPFYVLEFFFQKTLTLVLEADRAFSGLNTFFPRFSSLLLGIHGSQLKYFYLYMDLITILRSESSFFLQLQMTKQFSDYLMMNE